MSKERRLLSLVNAGHQLNLVNWPLVAVSGLFLSLRIFLKLRQRRPLWWDDYVLIISWLALVIYSSLFVVALNLGYGKDASEISPEDANKTLVITYVLSSLLILANLWSKTSFGITLLRLPIGRTRTWLVCALIGLGTIAIGSSAYFVWVQCLVADPPWGPYTGSRCLTPNVMVGYSVFVGCFSAAIDLAFVVLPWKFLWGLEMKRSEKVGAILAMGMGTFAAAAAVAKTTAFPRVYTDDTTAALQVSAWGALETAVSIMAASIPILRALVRNQGGQGVPMGYNEMGSVGTGATGRTEGWNVFNRLVDWALSRSRASTARLDSVADEAALSGKVRPVDEEEGEERASFEMNSYGGEVRPRDFTV